eukprot:1136588-Pelagomonas_calceolata.AAC.2
MQRSQNGMQRLHRARRGRTRAWSLFAGKDSERYPSYNNTHSIGYPLREHCNLPGDISNKERGCSASCGNILLNVHNVISGTGLPLFTPDPASLLTHIVRCWSNKNPSGSKCCTLYVRNLPAINTSLLFWMLCPLGSRTSPALASASTSATASQLTSSSTAAPASASASAAGLKT